MFFCRYRRTLEPFQRQRGETSERRDGAHLGFSERINTVLNWTELNWTELWVRVPLSACRQLCPQRFPLIPTARRMASHPETDTQGRKTPAGVLRALSGIRTPQPGPMSRQAPQAIAGTALPLSGGVWRGKRSGEKKKREKKIHTKQLGTQARLFWSELL